MQCEFEASAASQIAKLLQLFGLQKTSKRSRGSSDAVGPDAEECNRSSRLDFVFLLEVIDVVEEIHDLRAPTHGFELKPPIEARSSPLLGVESMGRLSRKSHG